MSDKNDFTLDTPVLDIVGTREYRDFLEPHFRQPIYSDRFAESFTKAGSFFATSESVLCAWRKLSLRPVNTECGLYHESMDGRRTIQLDTCPHRNSLLCGHPEIAPTFHTLGSLGFLFKDILEEDVGSVLYSLMHMDFYAQQMYGVTGKALPVRDDHLPVVRRSVELTQRKMERQRVAPFMREIAKVVGTTLQGQS